MKTNRIVFCFIIMGFIVKGQIRSIEVQSQTDMQKIYFDYLLKLQNCLKMNGILENKRIYQVLF